MQSQTSKVDSPEELLLDYAERVGYHRRGRVALWIRLSHLEPVPRPEARQNLVFQLFQGLMSRFAGQSFALADGDVVFAFKGPAERAFEQPLYRLRYSFRDDPLVLAEDEDGEARLAQVYRIEDEHEAFLADVRAAIARSAPPAPDAEAQEADEGSEAEPSGAQEGGHLPDGLREAVLSADQIRQMDRAGFRGLEPRQRRVKPEIDLATLWRTESFASGLRRLIRWQPALRLALEGPSVSGRQSLGHEVLRILGLPRQTALELVLPGLELAGNPALRSYAEAQVERGLLRLLPDYMTRGGPALVLPLSMDALLSAEFLELDRGIADVETEGSERPRLCFALTADDIAENRDTLDYARAFLERGEHRLALDGLPVTELIHFRLDDYPVDLVLLDLPEETAASQDPSLVLELRHAIGRLGRERLVLVRCTSEEQVAFGRRLGLCIFQGPAAQDAADALKDAARPAPAG